MKELESVKSVKENPVKLIDDDWGLVCACDGEEWNGMTISWGGIGELWNRDVVFVFIRPQRYTKVFMDKSEWFTVSFFDEDKKETLKICGTKSGGDCDKMKLAGLTPVFDNGAVYPKEARLVLKCRKIAVQEMDNAGFLDKTIEQNYLKEDYHFIYVGEIEKVFEK